MTAKVDLLKIQWFKLAVTVDLENTVNKLFSLFFKYHAKDLSQQQEILLGTKLSLLKVEKYGVPEEMCTNKIFTCACHNYLMHTGKPFFSSLPCLLHHRPIDPCLLHCLNPQLPELCSYNWLHIDWLNNASQLLFRDPKSFKSDIYILQQRKGMSVPTDHLFIALQEQVSCMTVFPAGHISH